MAKKLKNKSDAFEAIQGNVEDLNRARTIDTAAMRNFDTMCLAVPAPLKPQQIKKLRERLRVSQPVFARYLDTSESTVEKW